MDYSDLIASGVDAADLSRATTIPETWKQGRTAYGGLTAALCLQAATPLAGGLPVRAVQVGFVGPVNGTVNCTPVLLRQGKNTVFVHVRMSGDEGILADAIITFGAARASALDFGHLPPPDVPPPEQATNYFKTDRPGPAFAAHFQMLLAGGYPPMSGAPAGDVSIWMRHRDPKTPSDAIALLALGDAPPPAAMSLFTQPARISSMTWMAEFLTETFETEDRWFLARHVAQTARYGYSSQAMTMWNSKREPVMVGRQTIAVFG
ncbi:thioesterase family protein [Hyphomonas sp.]|uniref:thioesterase family protein n=1 Tax=Hyphomonas sp. TaxID=87 RepID=UPI0025B846D9|nr:thioesterase family protein [Hyphomonas sp.]MBI1401045.1 thioesterase family protein [Hyphomonas sp.]